MGVVFTGVDEVTFTPPSPPSPSLPYPSTLPSFRPNLRTTITRAATSGSKRAGESFDLRLMMVRYKCRTLNYLAYGGRGKRWQD